MEAYVNNSGVASRLVCIHELANLSFDTKVRFLGCVMQYDPETGLLYLHEPPFSHSEDSKDNSKIVAGVDISMIEVKADLLAAGNWINIIGYIDRPKYKPLANGDKSVQGVKIQAQSLWDAGMINVEEYFESVTKRREAFD